VVGYNVYRGTVAGGPYTQVNSSLVNGTTYSDTTVASGTTYFYVVTAVDPHNLVSDRSAEISATTPPLPATNLTAASASTGSVQLNWGASTTASVTGYNVYRSPSSGGGYVKITLVNGTSYTDTGLTSGTPYYYVVTAVGPGNLESVNSNEAFATAP
jgi:fibronectin type 3 domain-containing protein